eukprot:Awhi_evm1s11389
MARLTKSTQPTPTNTKNKWTSGSTPIRSIKNMKNQELKKAVSTLRLELEKANRSIEKARTCKEKRRGGGKGKSTNGNEDSLNENTMSKTETEPAFKASLIVCPSDRTKWKKA